MKFETPEKYILGFFIFAIIAIFFIRQLGDENDIGVAREQTTSVLSTQDTTQLPKNMQVMADAQQKLLKENELEALYKKGSADNAQ